MPDVTYSFVTRWRVHAPIGPVWDAITRAEAYPSWWKSVARVDLISSGDSGGSGRTYRSFWRTRLLYTLTFEARTTRVVVPTVIEIESRGELNGAGRWSLAAEGSATRVRYDWNVSTTKTWMNWLAPVLRPLFAWNHDAVMKDGAAGLAKLLNAQVETLKEQD